MTSRDNSKSSKRNNITSLSPNFSDFVGQNITLSSDGRTARPPTQKGKLSPKRSPTRRPHRDNKSLSPEAPKRNTKSLSPKFEKDQLLAIPGHVSPLHHSSGKLKCNPEPERPNAISSACPIDEEQEQEIRILCPEGPRCEILRDGVAVAYLQYHPHHRDNNSDKPDVVHSHEGKTSTEDHSDSSSADAECDLSLRWTVTDSKGDTLMRIGEQLVHEDEQTVPAYLRQKKNRAFRMYTTHPIYKGQFSSSQIPRGVPKWENLYHAADLRAKPAGILGNQVSKTLRVRRSDGKRYKWSLVATKQTGELSVVDEQQTVCAWQCSETSCHDDERVKVLPGTDPLLVALFLSIGKDL